VFVPLLVLVFVQSSIPVAGNDDGNEYENGNEYEDEYEKGKEKENGYETC
jgi:hypothetical protein